MYRLLHVMHPADVAGIPDDFKTQVGYFWDTERNIRGPCTVPANRADDGSFKFVLTEDYFWRTQIFFMISSSRSLEVLYTLQCN